MSGVLDEANEEREFDESLPARSRYWAEREQHKACFDVGSIALGQHRPQALWSLLTRSSLTTLPAALVGRAAIKVTERGIL